MRKTRERRERLQAMLAEPETFDALCEFIVESGTLAEWCRKHDVKYVEVHAWLHDVDHPTRLERYTLALEGRDSHMGDMLKAGLRDIAMADIRKLYDGKGKLLDPHKLPDELARVVAEVHEDEDERGKVKRKVRLESRKGGHELLGRALGLYRDRIEHEGKLTLEELVGGAGGKESGSHKGPTGILTPGRDEPTSSPSGRSPSKP